jgi:lysophospholipase L1-like esterase
MLQPKKNKLYLSLWLSLTLVVGLLFLSFLPEVSIGTFRFKKIDLLSDLRPNPPIDSTTKIDSTSLKEIVQFDSAAIKAGIYPIEDFSGNSLEHFYGALKKSNQRPVRIAFYGDSFIEGDIISDFLRDTLQDVYGGEGVGFVPLASEVSNFRKSIQHTFSNWSTYTLLSEEMPDIPLGISGYSYVPEEGNTVTYKPGKKPVQNKFKTVKILYQNKGTATINYTINVGPEIAKSLKRSDSVNQLLIESQAIQSIRMRFSSTDDLTLFGVSFDDTLGLYVDNFSMRSNSGIALAKLSPRYLKQFNAYLDYKLIILQYGLNVALETDSTTYGWYIIKMTKIIRDLKSSFPDANFLLLSVSDRGINDNGKIITMNGIPVMRAVQREIARQSGIAFWDMYEAMGGKNSMSNYTEAKPPLAAKDYTHLNHKGGKIIGKKLAEALLYEINKHETKNNFP